ncbi:MAG: hypothetical protein GX651_01680 [Methanomicrobiales archaeon]|nr:hypothetical protein [Methanomicrobiales archaeon]
MAGDRDYFIQVEPQVRAISGPARVSRINRGYSFEQKYLLEGEDNTRFLLRIASTPHPAHRERKIAEYEMLQRLMEYSSLVPKARSFGTTPDGALCFMILSYFYGSDGEEVLGMFNEKEQYHLGVRAGEELKNSILCMLLLHNRLGMTRSGQRPHGKLQESLTQDSDCRG